MGDQKDLIDETAFNRPEFVQYFGGLNEHTVLYYFAESQFFDLTCNNATLLTQALYNPSMAYIRESRQSFESALSAMQGVEFVLGNEQPIPEGNEVWIVKKQNRRKIPNGQDQLTVLAVYYIVGDSIYAAPTIGNILQSKLLSVTSSLNSLFKSAAALPLFTPVTGHRYIMPSSNPVSAVPATFNQPVEAANEAAEPADQPNGQKLTLEDGQTTMSTSDARVLWQSYHNFSQYRNEYMDENPLRGEPGSFTLTSTQQHLQHQAAQKVPTMKAQSDTRQSSLLRDTASGTPQPSDDAASSQKIVKNANGLASSAPDARPKPKRRKSKISPTTPTSTAGP